jgi:hypothetical protein
MVFIKGYVVILLMVIISACSDTGLKQPANSLPDNQENRIVLAKRFLEIMSSKEMLQNIEMRVIKRLSEQDAKIFKEVIDSNDIEKAAYQITLDGLIKHFTTGELNSMLAFYGSPEGRSAYLKFNAYMTDIMPQIQEQVKKAYEEAQKKQKPQEQQKSQEQQKPKAQMQPPESGEPKKQQGKK